jgi:hypothetical protein
MSSLLMTKQLIINSLRIPHDMRDEIKSYIFVDIVYANSRKRKNKLILGLEMCLKYHPWNNNAGQWMVSYGYEVLIKCETCDFCGGYRFIEMVNIFTNIAPRAICSCDGFEEYYRLNLDYIDDVPLNLIL